MKKKSKYFLWIFLVISRVELITITSPFNFAERIKLQFVLEPSIFGDKTSPHPEKNPFETFKNQDQTLSKSA